MSTLRIFGTSLLLAPIFVAGCTGATKHMTALPMEAGAPSTAHPPATIVLFRLTVEEGGDKVAAPLSAQPRGKRYFRVGVALDEELLDSSRVLAAGQLDRASADAGWGFLTLPAGRYRFAYSALRTQFLMTGARDASLGRGSSTPYRLEVPSGAALLYVGTFALSCQRTERWWSYVAHECTKLEVRDEQEQARQIASTSLNRYGPIRVNLATVASAAGK
jgi:hypothetical protein